MSATETPRQRGRPVDHGKRKRAQRQATEAGIRVYIPAEVLEDAGFSRTEPAPWYRVVGHARSRNAGTVLVSLYREP